MANDNDCRCLTYTIAAIVVLCVMGSFVDDTGEAFSNMIDRFDPYSTISHGSCQPGVGSGSSTKDDYSPCNSDPNKEASCCSRNEILKVQIETIEQGSSCESKRLAKVARADRICVPNIGTMYAGATVISTRDSIPYKHPQGTPESERTNKPSVVIKPGRLNVGKNWHFAGIGSLVIRLFYPAQISGFSVLHPPTCEIPKGYETSTPKNFLVQGLHKLEDGEPFVFGNFTYDINGPETQLFSVEKCSPEKFQLIEFRFLSNYGNPDYTALYKVRIHGDMGPPPHLAKNSSGLENRSGDPNDEFDDTITAF